MARNKEESDEEYDSELVELHEGIVNDDLSMLKQVLESGMDVNQKFTEDVDQQHIDMTPLSLAAALNKVKAIQLLLNYNANVDDTFAALKTTALMTSSFHGHSEIVKLLLKKNANVNAVDVQGSTALGYAFGGTKNIEVIDRLLKEGIDVNLKNMLGMNALLLVAGYSNDLLVKMILDAGADANAVNDFNHSALHIVVVGKWSQIRNITGFGKMASSNYGLQRRNLDLALKDWARNHRNLLRNGREDEKLLDLIGQFMMEIGSRYREPEHKPDTEDDQETMKKRVEAVWSYRQDQVNEAKSKKSGVIDNLLSCGGKRGKKVKQGKGDHSSKPLNANEQRPNLPAESEREILDISEKCAKILKYIIDAGCEIDKVEKTFGMTALDMSILFGDVESTAVLASAGGDAFHLLKMFSLTELYDAIVSVNKKRTKEILLSDPHIDVNQKFSSFNMTARQDGPKGKDVKSDGLTPIAVAAQMSEAEVFDIVKMLQKHGGDVNAVGSSGSTPLAEASRVGNIRMVEYLVNQGASVELPSPCYDNATPVTLAASNKHYNIVDFLSQQKQAKLDKKLTNGKVALILATENDDKIMVEKILQANLLDNFSDRNGFTYEMAKEFQKPDKNFNLIMKNIQEEVGRVRDINENKPINRQQYQDNNANKLKPQEETNRVSGPINVGANQTKPQYNFKPAINQPRIEESEEEDDDDEDEEESEEEKPVPQQKKEPIILNQRRQNIPKDSESDETDEEEEAAAAAAAQRRTKKVVTTTTTKKVVQQPPKKLPDKEESSEEETEEEEEEDEEENVAPKKTPQPAPVSKPSVQTPKPQSVTQARTSAQPHQQQKPQRPASESEESEEESEEESDEEDVVDVKRVNGNVPRKTIPLQKPPQAASTRPPQQQTKQVQESDEEEEEEDDDEEEDEEEEQSYTVQQKIVILPSQKVESRYTTRTVTERVKEQPNPTRRLVETYKLSPVTAPPPLPASLPPDDDEDDDDYDEDVDEEGYGEQFPSKVANWNIITPNKQSKSSVTKTIKDNNSTTVVTRTIVTSTKTDTKKTKVPIPMESDDDDDDVDEEYDDEHHHALGTETDI